MSDNESTISLPRGMHVTRAADLLVEQAKTAGLARGTFCGVEMIAIPSSTAAELVADWKLRVDQQTDAYRASPEGVAAARKRAEAFQARYDVLVAALPGLDWTNDVVVLEWLCALQHVSGHPDVQKGRTSDIVAAFEAQGLRASGNTGAEYNAEDRENVFRYLVGQALDGLKKEGIQPILADLAGEWRRKFGIGSPNRHEGRIRFCD